MPSSFVAYIDESGDDGFRQDKGSSHWLVLAAVVFRAAREATGVAVVDEVRERLSKSPLTDLHFSDMKHMQRVVYVTSLSKIPMRGIVVAVHKPSIIDQGRFQVKGRLYQYAVRLLVERISWLCDYYRGDDGGDGKVDLFFSHRRTTSYESLKKYLNALRGYGTEIAWDVIDTDRVQALPHKLRKGLWLADCVASSFFSGLELNSHGLTEGRYAESLKPVVWGRKGAFAGSGVTVFPKEALTQLDVDGQHEWLRVKFGIPL